VTVPEDDPLFLALRKLRAEYLAEAPAKIAELWSAFERVQNEDREAAGALRTLMHRLAGSGGAYGLPDVTDCARKAEQLIDRLLASTAGRSAADVAQLREHLVGIADAFERARTKE
jgi:HPt (histidine-containing phosphotransfer) domain-containing protein